MDTGRATEIELQIRRGEFDQIEGNHWQTIVNAFPELYPECFFNYQRHDGVMERRCNPYLLTFGELIARISKLSPRERRGRIRKDV